MQISFLLLSFCICICDSVKKNWLQSPPSSSLMSKYKSSTIVSDSAACVTIGNYIMLVQHGSLIDAAIATQLCAGVLNMESLGVGGGSFIVYYEKSTRKLYTLDFREVAPLTANETMFIGKPQSSDHGGLSIAVPGEIAGYYAAWQKWGKIPWKKLFQPTIELLRKGFKISPFLSHAIQNRQTSIEKYGNEALRDFLYNWKEHRWHKEGDCKTNKKLAKTLEIISQEPLAMYNGSLTKTIVKEIRDSGGIITAEDLAQYRPVWRQPLAIPLNGVNYVLHTMEPPSSGILVAFILNIMSDYVHNTRNISTLKEATTYLHRFVEASKFAFAKRFELGDMRFSNKNITNVMDFLKDIKNSEHVRRKINDSRTFPPGYYGNISYSPNDHGTSHFSGIDSEGNAVAISSTINNWFGSLVMGSQTGIIYNNEMDDFSTPNKSNLYGIPPSPSNFIRPGKRPMSTMSPVIVTDATTRAVKLVIGGTGGSLILSCVSQVAWYHLYLNKTVKEATDMWRFHNQLYPNEIKIGEDFPKEIRDELQTLGHILVNAIPHNSVQVLAVGNDGHIYGNADYRKGGLSIGL